MASRTKKHSTAKPSLPIVFDCKELGPILNRYEKCVATWRLELPKIVQEFSLQDFDRTFYSTMIAALEAYNRWNAHYGRLRRGLGPKSDTAKLANNLKRALKLLAMPHIQNRIDLAANEMPPPGATFDKELMSEFGASQFESTTRAAAHLENLLEVVEVAHKLDGRRLNALPRGDLRAAAEPLHHFWSQIAKRCTTVSQWGGEGTDEVEFLHACLKLIDHECTTRLIADFEL